MGRREEKLPSRKANEITESPLISTAYTIQFNTIQYNLLVKFADDITVSLPIEANVGLDESEAEVLSFIEWSENNCMKVI